MRVTPKSIELVSFKGVKQLSCDFDDLTLLAGLNNSGKTTILQGIYLLFSALPRIVEHSQINHARPEVRSVSLQAALSPLGLRDSGWLSSVLVPDVIGTVTGTFANKLRIELGITRNSTSFQFTVSHPDNITSADEIRSLTSQCATASAAILTPPGDVPSREKMVNGDDYQNRLREGQGAQLWRNGIWWAIQADGFETFGPVQQQIKTYFPDVEMLSPTLSTTGTPEILIKYKERGKGPLDIAQSGAGLRTFVSLARILEQSTAKVILLDEPDSHLHASQQSVIVDLMLDAAASSQRQVIIASHSPEVIKRVPAECLRWVDRDNSTAEGGYELSRIMEHLGVSPGAYVHQNALPDILVYVEGVDDRPIIEALISWCRVHSATKLPTTLVVPHRDGRFKGPTLQGIVRFAREIKQTIRVVGIRDLDWDYSELPGASPSIDTGDGWELLTLPCKELENLYCEATLLIRAYDAVLGEEELRRIICDESNSAELVDEWRYQVRQQIRDRLPNSLDPSTRERTADEMFNSWANDEAIRCRLVAGKGLLRQVRHRIRESHGKSFYPIRLFDRINELTPTFGSIATSIFPSLDSVKQP
ncbi:MAG: AAA family ATPase [Planctomycetota bacterium]|nr:AAA family ATPase [Planctomycetota bacterium]